MAIDSSDTKKGGRQDQGGQGSGSILDTDPLAELARLVAESAPFGPLDAKPSPETPRQSRVVEPAAPQPAPTPAAPSAPVTAPVTAPVPREIAAPSEPPAARAPLAGQQSRLDQAPPRMPDVRDVPGQHAPRAEPPVRPLPPVEPLISAEDLAPPSLPSPSPASEPVKPLFTAKDIEAAMPAPPKPKPASTPLSFSFGGLDRPAAPQPQRPAPAARPQVRPEPEARVAVPSPPLSAQRAPRPLQAAPAPSSAPHQPEQQPTVPAPSPPLSAQRTPGPVQAASDPRIAPRQPEPPVPAPPVAAHKEPEPSALELSDEFAADLEASLRETLFGDGEPEEAAAPSLPPFPAPVERGPEPAPDPFLTRHDVTEAPRQPQPFTTAAGAQRPLQQPQQFDPAAERAFEPPQPRRGFPADEPRFENAPPAHQPPQVPRGFPAVEPGFESAAPASEPLPGRAPQQSEHLPNLEDVLEEEMASILNEDVYEGKAGGHEAYGGYADEGIEQVPHFEEEQKHGKIPVFGIVAGVVIVAIFGGAGAVSYRAIFGESANEPPPVISAGVEPLKVRPENDETQTDVEDPLVLRTGDDDSVENTRIVSRVEDLAALPQTGAGEAAKIEDRVPQGNDAVTPLEPRVVRPAPISPDGGVDGPRRVRTLTVRPDGTIEAPPEPQTATQPAPAAQVETPLVAAPAATPIEGNAASAPGAPAAGATAPAPSGSPSTIPLPPPRPGIAVSPLSSVPQTGATATAQTNATGAPGNAPLEVRRVAVERITADGSAPAPTGPVNLVPQTPAATAQSPAQNQQQTAAVAPAPVATQTPAPVSTGTIAAAAPPSAVPQGGFVVQLASRRTEEQALATFSDFQSRFGGQLGSYQPLIQRADLGDRGIFYRVQVGPMAEREAANQLCSDLKSAGLPDCFVQRN